MIYGYNLYFMLFIRVIKNKNNNNKNMNFKTQSVPGKEIL